jgi:glycerol-3-phosphate acyltransferase PlsY
MTNVSKRIVKAPKFYFLDTGLVAYLCGWPNAEMIESGAMSGAFFETYCVAEIVKNLRNFGKKAGAIVFIGDIAKCVLAYYLCSMIFGFSGVPGRLLGLYGAVGAVIGHCFPFYMQFRGGKGIACLVGLMIAFSPQTLLNGVAVFFAVFAVTNYVSLGSLLCVLAFLITTIIKGQSGAYNMSGAELIEMYLVLSAVVALTWYQHRENIKRLLSGTERKTYLFKKNK